MPLGVHSFVASCLQVGRDPRPVMRLAYECFQTGEDPSKVALGPLDMSDGQAQHMPINCPFNNPSKLPMIAMLCNECNLWHPYQNPERCRRY